jgi:YggT family protein
VVVLGIIIEFVLWFYILFILIRIVADWVQMFARSWQPGGATLVVLELIYSATDPPIRMLRRIVPPLRLGSQAFDLSVLFVLLICYVVLFVNRQTLLIAG